MKKIIVILLGVSSFIGNSKGQDTVIFNHNNITNVQQLVNSQITDTLITSIIEVNQTEIKVKNDPGSSDTTIYSIPRAYILRFAKGNGIKRSNAAQVNLIVYSDLQGLSEKQPNAIIQPSLSASISLNNKPFNQGNRIELTLVKNLMFLVNAWQVKQDTSFRYFPLSYLVDSTATGKDTIPYIHVLNIVKYASFAFSAKVNLLTIAIKEIGLKLFIDDYPIFYCTGISDSLLPAQYRQYRIYSVGNGMNYKLRFKQDDSHYRFDISYTQYGLTLLHNSIVSRQGKLYYPESSPKNIINNKNDLTNNLEYANSIIGIYSFEIRYSSKINKENDNDGIFIRMMFYTNPIKSLTSSTKGYGNNYLQLQFGISKNIVKLWETLKP